jgi:hypothetical protein
MLAKKLGIKAGMTVLAIDAPREYRDWLGELPEGACIVAHTAPPYAAVHLFSKEKISLVRTLEKLRKQILQDGFVWVSWPKKASKVQTNLTEDIIRDVALPMDFVDVKVCAVSDVWSGLKLMIRKERRTL